MAKKLKINPGRVALTLVLAWLIPGAGHICIGRTVRGVIICITITAMFWTGIAIGGMMTVDKELERWWFAADLLTGVHGLVAWRRSEAIYRRIKADLEGNSEYRDQRRGLPKTRAGRPAAEAYQTLRQQYYRAAMAEEGIAVVHPGGIVARAYAGVAGLLNLLCIFDAVILSMMAHPGEPPPPKRKKRTRKTDVAEGT